MRRSANTISPSTDAPFDSLALRANLAGFAFNGVLMGIYGPMLEAVAVRFNVSLATAGTLVGIHFFGALIGASSFWKLLHRYPPQHLLFASYGALAFGLAAAVVASVTGIYPLLCGGALAAGIGFGGLDYGLSQIFASSYHERKTQMLNLLHGAFGVGTALGPLTLGLIGVRNYPVIFAVGFAIAVSGMTFGRRGRIARLSTAGTPGGKAMRQGFAILSWATFLFVVLYLLHVAVQGSIGEWEPTQLKASGFDPQLSSFWTAAYWGGIAVSRLAIAHGRITWSPRQIVITCCIGTCLAAAATFLPAARPVAYVVFGLFIGPIFPVGLSWLSAMLRDPDDGIAAVVITSLIGGIIFPPLLGIAITQHGVSIIPVALLALSIFITVTACMLPGRHRATHAFYTSRPEY